jgi:hypothetical protein
MTPQDFAAHNKEFPMPLTLEQLSGLLRQQGLRHHLDEENRLVRIVFATRRYRNLRGEHLAIVELGVSRDGGACQVAISRAFRPTGGCGPACLALCTELSDSAFVSVRHDAELAILGLTAAIPVEDGAVTAEQLFALVDQLIEAAESGQQIMDGIPTRHAVQTQAGRPAA